MEAGKLATDCYGRAFRITGLVQGVGFRPTVWRLANEQGLKGSVLNDAEGVWLELWGSEEAVLAFPGILAKQLPNLARIDAVESFKPKHSAPDDFHIAESCTGRPAAGIVADAASCDECRKEIFDSTDRRFGYAFSNCTHCGPRLTIIQGIPYDRANTSMASFPMCKNCLAEYENPADRRFHAQPVACPECGPECWLEQGQSRLDERDPLATAAKMLTSGEILAIKGIGGFHLACDAANENVVARLRARKRRYQKPFAVMFRDRAQLLRHLQADADELQLLESAVAPIVLLQKQEEPVLAGSLAPGQSTLGVMLPYSPLHHLLMQLVDFPLVMTSANLSDEPQVKDNEQAREDMASIADAFLMHNRDIVNRVDDSVMRVVSGQTRVIRRARGLAPEPLMLEPGLSSGQAILAMGAELKSTVCLLREGKAIVSQHIGDLKEWRSLEDYRQCVALYRKLYDFQPDIVTCDLHPDFHSSKMAEALANEYQLPLMTFQHHKAHFVACMAEYGKAMDKPALGLVLDGFGHGEDGAVWGCEIFSGNASSQTRLASLELQALPGGNACMIEPWRNLYSHLSSSLAVNDLERYSSLSSIRFLLGKPLKTLAQMVERNLNAPSSSSAGRLFDAVAALLGLCVERQDFEGQAAMALEALAEKSKSPRQYHYKIKNDGLIDRVSLSAFWPAMLDDLHNRCPVEDIAAGFHISFANALIEVARRLCDRHGLDSVYLSGGVMQNRLLAQAICNGLSGAGLLVYEHLQYPANDGGISLGQAVMAAARIQGQAEAC